MPGQVQDCMYYQLKNKCVRGPRCVFYHRALEPDICRSFLFNCCKYQTNPRQCGKRHVTTRDLPVVTSKEKERVKQAKVTAKEALEEFNKPVSPDDETDEQDKMSVSRDNCVKEESNLSCLDCSVEFSTPWDIHNHELTIDHCQVVKKLYLDGKEPLGIVGDYSEWCIECNVRVSSNDPRGEHKHGKFHTSMEKSFELIESAVSSGQKLIPCYTCKIANIPHWEMRSHLYSQRHVEVLKALEMTEGILREKHPIGKLNVKENHPDLPLGVFVGNLSPRVNISEILDQFKKFGKVLRVSVPKINKDGDCAWSIVQFEKTADAEKAIETLNDTKMDRDGKKLWVKWKDQEKFMCELCKIYCVQQENLNEHYAGRQHLAKMEEKSNHQTTKNPRCQHQDQSIQLSKMPESLRQMEDNPTVYVGNLSPGIGKREIQTMFGKFGKLVNFSIPKVKQNSDFIFTFVHFEKMADAEKAIEVLHETKMDGRKLVVKWTEKFCCDLCKIYCYTQANLDQHYLGKQHLDNLRENYKTTEYLGMQQLSFDTLKTPKSLTHDTFLEDIPKKPEKSLAEFLDKVNISRKTESLKDDTTKRSESLRLESSSPMGDVSKNVESLKAVLKIKEKQIKSPPIVPLQNKSVKLRNNSNDTSQISKPFAGLGEGRRHSSGEIKCSLCGSMFKSTKDFAKHCISSEEHKAATAMLEQRMFAEAEEKRMNELRKMEVEKSEIQQKMMLQELHMHQLSTQQIPQQQMYPNPFLNNNGLSGDPVMLLEQLKQQLPHQSELVRKAEQMAIHQIQGYSGSEFQRQAEMQLQQLYTENRKIAAQMQQKADVEWMKQQAQIEKQKRQNIFLRQVEIGRLEELRKLKANDKGSVTTQAFSQDIENESQEDAVNTEIFQSDGEEEQEQYVEGHSM